MYALVSVLPQERLTVAVTAMAACEAMFEWTREYLKDRKAFGGPLSSMQVGGLWLITLPFRSVNLQCMFSVCLAVVT